jgi:hypothetical protein
MNWNWGKEATIGLCVLVCVACGKKPQTEQANIDPVFASQISAFEATTQRVGAPVTVKGIHIVTGEMPSSSTLAYCSRVTNDPDAKVIRLNAIVVGNSFFALSFPQQVAVLTHELGHCLWAQSHNSNLFSTGYPESVMYNYALPQAVWTQFGDWYTAKLVGGSTGSLADPSVP